FLLCKLRIKEKQSAVLDSINNQIFMLKRIIIIGVIFVGVFSNRLKNRLGFTKEECEAKGGSFCPGQEYRECYIFLNETVLNFWPLPFSAFLQNSLPTSDKCLDTTVIDVPELISDTRCSLDDKINVICEIPF
ncbi:hypothetical protein Avbf_18329, partial [Armadillidium vulgare]